MGVREGSKAQCDPSELQRQRPRKTHPQHLREEAPALALVPPDRSSGRASLRTILHMPRTKDTHVGVPARERFPEHGSRTWLEIGAV